MLTPSSKKRKLTAVLDTNVWISAMIWGGPPAKIIKAAENGQIRIFVTEEIIEEISQTLQYQRLREVYESANVNRQQLMETVLRAGKLVQVKSSVSVVDEDPSDNKFLECVLASEADYVVSGDRHLVKLKKYGKTRVVTVGEFIKVLRTKKSQA